MKVGQCNQSEKRESEKKEDQKKRESEEKIHVGEKVEKSQNAVLFQ